MRRPNSDSWHIGSKVPITDGLGADKFELIFHRANSSDGAVNVGLFYGERQWLSPEENLAMAVFLQALADADKGWFMRDDEDFLSFRFICEMFGLDYQAARKAILANLPKPQPVDRRWYEFRGVVADIPGVVYTHGYRCNNRYCAECMERYSHLVDQGVRSHKRKDEPK